MKWHFLYFFTDFFYPHLISSLYSKDTESETFKTELWSFNFVEMATISGFITKMITVNYTVLANVNIILRLRSLKAFSKCYFWEVKSAVSPRLFTGINPNKNTGGSLHSLALHAKPALLVGLSGVILLFLG